MNNLEKLRLLEKLKMEIGSIRPGNFCVCPHTASYPGEQLTFSAWAKTDDSDNVEAISIRMKDSGVIDIVTPGDYQQIEARYILNYLKDWLKRSA